MNRIFVMLVLVAVATALPAIAGTVTVTQNLSVQLDSVGKLSAPSTALLVNGGAAFSLFQGTLTISYRFRTAPSGSGFITARAASDFSPTGGPTLSGGSLRYSCIGAGLGTPCSGAQTVSASSATPVVQVPGSACTGGGGACSSSDPVTVQIQFQLDNSPQYSTGSYSVPLIFTVSTL